MVATKATASKASIFCFMVFREANGPADLRINIFAHVDNAMTESRVGSRIFRLTGTGTRVMSRLGLCWSLITAYV